MAFQIRIPKKTMFNIIPQTVLFQKTKKNTSVKATTMEQIAVGAYEIPHASIWSVKDVLLQKHLQTAGYMLCDMILSFNWIKEDYRFETDEDCSMSDFTFDCNDHKICEWNESIYDMSYLENISVCFKFINNNTIVISGTDKYIMEI